jgi:hypothetical protein
LEKEKDEKDMVFIPENFSGPTVLIRSIIGERKESLMEIKGRSLVLKYSKKIPAHFVIICK